MTDRDDRASANAQATGLQRVGPGMTDLRMVLLWAESATSSLKESEPSSPKADRREKRPGKKASSKTR